MGVGGRVGGSSPKAPCSYMVNIWGPKGLPYNYFRAEVYTIELHGAFG